jgi:glycosyltransferase involved in cell wall biosynthesis
MTTIYREVDVFVLTSDWEGTPNVVLEASACGLPVVATRAGGTSAVVCDGETGLLCDCTDEEGLVSAIMRLVNDRELRHRMGERGRRFVEENHASTRLAQFLAEIYSRVMS